MNTEQAELFVANTSAMFTHDGRSLRIIKGKTTARRGAKILKGREHLFDPLVIDFDAPNSAERRGPGRPKKEELESKVVATSEVKHPEPQKA